MYKQALEIFSGNERRLSLVNTVFSEYLEQRGYIEEAGFAYLRAGDLEKSMNAFLNALNIDMVFSVAA